MVPSTRMLKRAAAGGAAAISIARKPLDSAAHLSRRAKIEIVLRRESDQARLRSIASQSRLAMSAPPNFFTARMPVGEVTLISVI